ncbi:protein JINGUBANG-like [Ipomoea triloba]|uniref:protein JINGUBANG-like n=1 Tax=Ipomoea triloba TaxID=35885 RepID=UPI00125E1851|nr:protein JINGUBANG-like [Ipomoea triloba]
MAKTKNSEAATLFSQKEVLGRQKLGAFLFSDPAILSDHHEENDDGSPRRRSSSGASSAPSPTRFLAAAGSPSNSSPSSPFFMSPWSQVGASPYVKSPWILQLPVQSPVCSDGESSLIGSIVREEGHVYSLAASGGLLYTGSDSRNIRVWDKFEEYSGFKSNSGLVKAIVVWGGKVFTGHQDGKIRVWKVSGLRKKSYTRLGSLPTTKDYIKSSMNPKAYVAVRRNRSVPWNKHFDAVSSMSVDLDQGLLYSGSWDKTVKVWRLRDSKCIESVKAHDDAVNSVAVGFDGFIFTGSADGMVKAWRRELVGNVTKHVLVETLLNQESAVTSLAVNAEAAAVYAGSSDGLVNFWEREKHFVEYGGALRGHKLAVLCLVGAGRLVVSGSADKSICVWRREEGGFHTCVSVLTGHTGPVKCLAVVEEEGDNDDEAADGRWRLYSGSLDKSVKVWRLSEHIPDAQEM